jgi:DNA-binding SARP family transcriptional activator/tetratricopeptide (TPR) repeat protein
MDTVTEFCLLGPLLVRQGGVARPVAPGKQQAMLAALLLSAGRVVSSDELTEALWGSAAPPSARVAVQNHVMKLRKALGDGARIRTHPHGYQIVVDVGELDVSRFEAHLAAARAAARNGSWDAAAGQARAGLALWRGEPLADVESDLLATRDIPRLAELRLQAIEVRLDADLHLGRHAEVITEVQRLAAVDPLRERLHGLLMMALYRDGRQAEALAAYSRARQILVAELGTEPGAGLRELHRQILNGDPALDPPAQAPDGAHSPASSVPRQLPGAVSGFTGRAAELAALTRILDQASASAPGTVVISAIGGTAGVGKTALALHWAHQVAGRFGGGQLYVNLRGFDPSGVPMPAAEAVRGFLDALGVPPDRIPAQPEARAGLYRSLLADRSMLIVLDNARDEQQVRPLLPASPAALVIVTSRNQLGGLAAADRARLLALDVLSHDEAVDLLTARIGAGRAAAEPAAVGEIAMLCGRLPLALAVAAARAEARPSFPLAVLAAELKDRAGRLDALDAGEPGSSVRGVFSWSYRQLSGAAARLFRLLGLHPGPDISPAAAASLAAVDEPGARRLLAELTRAHLVAEHVPGRYALHDLLRAYATGQARETDSQPERAAAIGRVLDHYLHTARNAAIMALPSHPSIQLPPPSPGTTPERFTGYDQALAWFDAEHHGLLAALALAVDSGLDNHVFLMALLMLPFTATRGRDFEWTAIKRMSMAVGVRDDEAMVASGARDHVGTLGDYQWVPEYYADMASLYQRLGNRRAQAVCLYGLAAIAEYQGQYAEALGHAEQAASLFQTIGDKAGEAELLNAVGWYHALLGDYQQARAACRQALALNADYGSRHLEGNICNSLGYAEYHAGNLGEAAAHYQRALTIFRAVGDRWGEADTLTNLGDIHRVAGEPLAARQAWQQALAILNDFQHPDAAKIRDKLARMDPPAMLRPG